VRGLLREVLEQFDDFEVAGEARDGREASEQVIKLKPDVVTMDVVMPMVGGFEAVERIMDRCPVPVLMVADTDQPQAQLERALRAGAAGFFTKPRGGFDEAAANAFARTLRTLAAKRIHRSASAAEASRLSFSDLAKRKIIGIVSSTGGPKVLSELLGALPASLSVPIALVQHTTIGYTHTLAEWLNGLSPLDVRVATLGEQVRPGCVYVAPDDHHLEIRSGGLVTLTQDPPVASLRPAGDKLLAALARTYGRQAMGLVCTGMGEDGTGGLDCLAKAGGLCAVQEPGTAVLPSMPRAALQRVPTARRATIAEVARLLTRAFG
jgi:two-component system chemotaxis response regulator CheB